MSISAPFDTQALDLREQTLENNAYRRVPLTTAQAQIALMAIPVRSKPEEEVHYYSTQVITVVEGLAQVVLRQPQMSANQRRIVPGPPQTYLVKCGETFVVPANTVHSLANVGDKTLRLWTVYAPPVHLPDRFDAADPEGLRVEDDEDYSA